MKTSQHGIKQPSWGIAWFITDQGGYTSVAMAAALLVACSLVFAAATVHWTMRRSSEVQKVADAASLAGAQVVARYAGIAQIVDATVTTTGMTGVVMLASGLVLGLIPGTQSIAKAVLDTGDALLQARQSFVATAAKGLKTLETTLPALVAYNAAGIVEANSSEEVSYVGAAMPLPLQGESKIYESLPQADVSELKKQAEYQRQQAEQLDQAQERMRSSLLRAWQADSVDNPSSLAGRAERLAGLYGGPNTRIMSVDEWHFGIAIQRARAYYQARYDQETLDTSSVEQLVESAARKAFYQYALDEVRASYWVPTPDGLSADMDLHTLPYNEKTTRSTRLYTEALWPTTIEDGVRVLHASNLSPGATGPAAGLASLEDLESGIVALDDKAPFSIIEMGRVASASTRIQNGFEYYWSIICEEARTYTDAQRSVQKLSDEVEKTSSRAVSLLDAVLGKLKVGVMSIKPPGYLGCFALVMRPSETQASSSVAQAFVAGQTLPPGMAISGAQVAIDPDIHLSVLSGFFDSLAQKGLFTGQLLDGAAEVWNQILQGYQQGWGALSEVLEGFLDFADKSIILRPLARVIKNEINQAITDIGLDPPDLRLRKPMIINAMHLLDRAGYSGITKIKDVLDRLPSRPKPADVVAALGLGALDEIDQKGGIYLGEFTVPGTALRFPIRIQLSSLFEKERDGT